MLCKISYIFSHLTLVFYIYFILHHGYLISKVDQERSELGGVEGERERVDLVLWGGDHGNSLSREPDPRDNLRGAAIEGDTRRVVGVV